MGWEVPEAQFTATMTAARDRLIKRAMSTEKLTKLIHNGIAHRLKAGMALAETPEAKAVALDTATRIAKAVRAITPGTTRKGLAEGVLVKPFSAYLPRVPSVPLGPVGR